MAYDGRRTTVSTAGTRKARTAASSSSANDRPFTRTVPVSGSIRPRDVSSHVTIPVPNGTATNAASSTVGTVTIAWG
ncbi:hypothetical protein C488_17728 [Natrinema pellirubrum DSM 15624]|uniref:Uncharacterized protein n=1 Tax=Natrinema pellirubrum (strain DSM 15624 / CIP 106293 / JCM 10476 / NCIMB 786 / 157) TaxID=797303 RepID=L9YAZ7_NATP1|nr:hypothetical protein C488_17728 [Natrinema pellirubrum DSM 15624]